MPSPVRARLLLVAAAAAPAALAQSDNVLPNGGFESVAGDAPSGWRRARWGGNGEMTLAEGRAGRGVRITSRGGGDVGWSCTVPVAMASRYRLSGWIRTEDVVPVDGGKGALFNVHDLQPVQTPALTGTRDWTRVEVEFATGFADSVTINCLFGGWGQATGTAFYDDVELVLVEKGELPAPTITLDLGKVGAPLSKYVYGQFLEHLGRCIYGGIWAEVVEDRKFFAPPGGEGSPWRIVGPAAAVTVRADAPFADRPAVAVACAGDGTGVGIAQEIELRAGVEYRGHLWLRGEGSAGPITIGLGDEGEGGTVVVRALGDEWTRHALAFPARTQAGPARFRITSAAEGSFYVGPVSLMPADHVGGFRRDTLALLAELDAPVYRWPGGNFVSGYDWRDGIGDRDHRPPRKNPAWQGIEPNDVGLDEFIALCRLLHTEPYIALNTGLGTVENAVAELQYANGPADREWGRRREQNGHPEPYGVRFWGIGNEMYGDWQLGHVPLAEYVRRHNAFVDALRREDPTIQVIGVGAVGRWSETMLRECADRLDFLSEHVYWQERPGLLAHVKQAPDSLRRIAQAHRRYRRELASLRGRDIQIVQDEWNYWYGPHAFGELGTRYFVKDALGVAAALHEFARNSDLFFMANYAQTVNVIGAIKTTPQTAWLETTGLVLKLYRKEFGTLPVATECGPTIDAMAALSADRKTLRLGVVNATPSALVVPLTVEGGGLAPNFTWWTIAGAPEDYNDAGASKVRIAGPAGRLTADVPDDATPTEVRVPASSVTLFRFEVR